VGAATGSRQTLAMSCRRGPLRAWLPLTHISAIECPAFLSMVSRWTTESDSIPPKGFYDMLHLQSCVGVSTNRLIATKLTNSFHSDLVFDSEVKQRVVDGETRHESRHIAIVEWASIACKHFSQCANFGQGANLESPGR
jgi:hypothetical protein